MPIVVDLKLRIVIGNEDVVLTRTIPDYVMGSETTYTSMPFIYTLRSNIPEWRGEYKFDLTFKYFNDERSPFVKAINETIGVSLLESFFEVKVTKIKQFDP